MDVINNNKLGKIIVECNEDIAYSRKKIFNLLNRFQLGVSTPSRISSIFSDLFQSCVNEKQKIQVSIACDSNGQYCQLLFNILINQAEKIERIATFKSRAQEIFNISKFNNDYIELILPTKLLTEGLQTPFFEAQQKQFEILSQYQLLKQIKEINTNLESIVEKRTNNLNQANKELKQSIVYLKLANKELEQFSYIVSHDLKSPLRTINSLFEMMSDDLLSLNKPEVIEACQNIKDRIKHMHALLEDVLEYSRVGRMYTEKSETDLNEIISEIYKNTDISEQFKLTIAKKLPTIMTSRIQIYQVFLNLINNAYQHHDKDAGNIIIDFDSMQDYYRFSVTDDGPGIEQKYHQKIFEIFQSLIKS